MTRTLKGISALITAVFLLSAVVAISGEARAAQFNLSFASYDPATTGQMIMHQEWADRIKEKTGGRVEITIFAGGALAGPTAILDAVKTGAADIGWVYTSFYPGQFPITDAIALPMLGVETTTQGAKVLWDLYESSPRFRDELSRNGLKMLMLYSNPRNFVVTASKPVSSVDGLKGLKLRSPSGTPTDMLRAWGASPIMMGPGDVYQAVEKGVLDGYVFEYNGIDNFKLWEVSKFYTEIPFYVGPFLTMMNQRSFDKLPADIQKIIEEESGRAMSMALAARFQQDADAVRAKIAGMSGRTIIEVDAAVRAEFAKAAAPFADEWVKKNGGADFDAQAYLDKMKELIAAYAGS